jgi:hypothetical protein
MELNAAFAHGQGFCPQCDSDGDRRQDQTITEAIGDSDFPRPWHQLDKELDAIFRDPEQLRAFCIGRPLIQSRPLDVNIWADYPELTAVLDALAYEIDADGRRKRGAKEAARFREALRVLVLALYVAWKADPDLQVGINLNANWFRLRNRYGNPALTYRTFKAAYDGLRRLEYFAVDRRGYLNRKKGTGYNTKIRATGKLIDLLINDAQIEAHKLTRLPGAETIILKDEKDSGDYAQLLEYEDTEATNAMRDNLALINSVLEAHDIGLAVSERELHMLRQRLKGDPDKGPFDFNRRTLRRVFNNGCFDEGGRFYGGWWQQIPNDPRKGTEYRRHVTIDGEPTVELDFSGLHPRMLYAEIGLELSDDPYDVGQPAEYRATVKQAFNAMINAGERGVEEPDDYDAQAMGMTFDQLQQRIKAKHEPIAGFFFTGAGLRLQYRDSRIAERVMMHFARQGIPCLSIHDSFIVQERYARELETVMRETAREEVGLEIPVKGSELGGLA